MTPEPPCPAAPSRTMMSPPSQVSAETDREALVAFFEATDGETWDNSGLWAGSRPIGEWPGVTVDDSGRVVALEFSRGRNDPRILTGELPPELGNLTSLTRLALGRNQLAGHIPPELGNLVNLEAMILSKNQLTGEIPSTLGNLQDLTALDLSDNGHCGELPPELGGLANLTEFNLSGNQLIGKIPPELGNLENVTQFNLSRNQLTGEIPAELGNIGSRGLGYFVGLQTNIPELHPTLDLSDNLLTGEIPAELDRPWYYFDLSDNQFTGCVSDYLRDIPVKNQWRKGIDILVGLTVCEASDPEDKATLIAIYNAVGDPGWPGWLGREPIGEWEGVSTDREGRVIGLGNPGESGDMPPELGRLVNLEYLDGNLTGEIPPELGRLVNLEYLDLRGNLTGEIPPELGNLVNLRVPPDFSGTGVPPDLSRTRVCLPEASKLTAGYAHLCREQEALAAIERVAELVKVRVDPINDPVRTPFYFGRGEVVPPVNRDENGRVIGVSIRTEGVLPPELWSLLNLRTLHIWGVVNEELPPELGNLVNLKTLYISAKVTGGIPPELGNLVNLETFYLHTSGFTGEIPPELGKLTNLKILDLRSSGYVDHPRLSGEIPPELGNLSNLSSLNLESNSLSGEIPPQLGNLANLRFLQLSDNQLTGEIPPELGNLANLEAANLMRNQLTGEIPAELENLAKLEALYLTGSQGPSNKLSGCVPSGILTTLRHDPLQRLLPTCQ